jgi:Flp pilus assembly protein TadD
MGVGEALAISESDTFALTAVADRDCRPNTQLTPAAGSPVVPASTSMVSSRRACVQTIARNVEVMMQRVHTAGAEAYRGLVDFVASLRGTPGPKTVVLVTNGFTIALDAGVFDELAIRAALSDVAVHGVLVEPTASGNTRRLVPANVVSERRSLMRRLTEMTGAALGGAHSVVGDSQEPYDRLMTSSARYRLVVRDGGTSSRDPAARVAVTVAGAGLTVRARPYFVAPSAPTPSAASTPEARLSRALAGTVSTAPPLALDAAGYLAGLPGETAALLIAGEIRPTFDEGAAPDAVPALTIGYLLLDARKQPVVRGPVPPIEPAGGPAARPAKVQFAGSVDGLAPGSYTLRVAATDGDGRVGFVEREIELKAMAAGPVSAGDLLVGRIEGGGVTLTPGTLDAADTVFLQWDLDAPRGAVTAAAFRIVQDGGSAVLTLPAEVEGVGATRLRASAIVKPGLLPAGNLAVVATIAGSGGAPIERRRAFAVRGGTPGTAPALTALIGDVALLAPRFDRGDVLAAPLLERALKGLDSRVRTEAGRKAVAQARSGARTGPDAGLSAADPVAAAFLAGLADLSAVPVGPAADASARALARADLERAAQRFREAMRHDADFLPAAIFLGACYALGGRDDEAAGAWQTALIAVDDEPRLFALIVDARLRAGDAAGAESLMTEAASRWPADPALRARRIVVDLAVGRFPEALAALDALDAAPAATLFAAMRVLHGVHTAGRAVEDPARDRARLERYAARYAALDGPDQALVSGWLAAWK